MAWRKHRVVRVVDLANVWKKLKVISDPFLPEGSSCGGDCEARIYRNELDGRVGREVILKLTHSYESCRYLIFTRSNSGFRTGGWKFLGSVDHAFNRYQMSNYRIIRALRRKWLVVRGQEGSGSGYALYGDTWYTVTPNRISPVLSYPANGQTYPWPAGLARRFTTSVKTHSYSIIIEYVVTYTMLNYERDESEPLVVNRHHARMRNEKIG